METLEKPFKPLSGYIGLFLVLVIIVIGIYTVVEQRFLEMAIASFFFIIVLPGFFSIVHAANRGGAFSLFADAHEIVRLPFFFAAAVVAVGFLVYFVRQVPTEQRVLLFALAAVLGGALGNLIDRALFGQVTDFLLVYYHGWTWPAFNVADSFISIGVTILVAHSIFGREADQPHAA